MSLQIADEKKKEFVAGGGPEAVQDFLGEAVNEMHQKAVATGAVYKEGDAPAAGSVAEGLSDLVDNTDAVEEAVVEDTSDVEDVAVEEADEAVVAEEVAEEEQKSVTVNPQEAIQSMIVAAVSEGIATYHETVVAPLEAELKSLKEKDNDPFALNSKWGGAFDLLPPNAIAQSIKQQFKAVDTSGEDVQATAEELDAVVTEVTVPDEVPVAVSGNLLAGF